MRKQSLMLLCCLFATSALALAQRYTITDLGPLAPTGINSWAQVVGNYKGHAYLWAKWHGLRDLGLLPAGTFSAAAGINDLGVVTGTADGPGIVNPGSDQHQECSDLAQPFMWTRGSGMQGLNVLAPHSEGPADCELLITYSTGINDRNQVVGYNQGYFTFQWGFLWTGGTITPFGGSWEPTSINAISNTGQMVGQDAVPDNFFYGHATSWLQDGTSVNLATLDGGTDIWTYSSSANGVNDLGQIVGWSTTTAIAAPWLGFRGCDATENSGCPIHAVLWAAGAIRDLGTLPGDTNSVAGKTNFFGQVIGSSGNVVAVNTWPQLSVAVTGGRPFIWTEHTGMRDLNTLIPARSGWVLNAATDINIWGQIVGSGTRNGQPHGFLLTLLDPFHVF